MKIVFLDDDQVVRIARYVLQNAEDDVWVHDFFAPEQVDMSRVAAAARGLTRRDGVEVELADGAVRNADIIVFRRGEVTREIFAANPRLRLVQRLGERPEGIDLASAGSVPVSCLPRRTLSYTAEHAILLMLALEKRLLLSDQLVRQGSDNICHARPIDNVAYNWPGLSGVGGLVGRTLGIVGLGEVGSLVARLALAFGMRVLYNKRNRLKDSEEQRLQIEFAELGDLLARADFVSLHAANLPANDKLVGQKFLSAMKPSAFFINTSRGRLVDEDALYDVLIHRRIAGAGLDAHRSEPRVAHDRFSTLDNVILTPHLAGGARGGLLLEIEIIFKNIHAALRGAAPEFQLPANGSNDA